MTDKNIKYGNYTLSGLNKINLLLGRNGVGKSKLLQAFERNKSALQGIDIGVCRYLSPERAGVFQDNPSVAINMSNNKDWVENERSKNNPGNFREQTAVTLKGTIFNIVMKEGEDILPRGSAKKAVGEINSLLDNLYISFNSDNESKPFNLYRRETGEIISDNSQISSGEAELITLASEIITFETRCINNSKDSFLLIDEPDSHLHPDLQIKFCKFLDAVVKRNKNIHIIIATHSMPMIIAFAGNQNARVCYMQTQMEQLSFKALDDHDTLYLHSFEPSPLSIMFCQAPILIVEGEDDVRIWYQAVRTSKRKINVSPYPNHTKDTFADIESNTDKILSSISDNAMAFSIQDGDTNISRTSEIKGDGQRIKRFYLQCNEIENLLLTDEVFSHFGTNWENFKNKIVDWLEKSKTHEKYSVVKKFQEDGWKRREADIKNARGVIAKLLGSDEPYWETVIGKVIGGLALNPTSAPDYNSQSSIYTFLGKEIIEAFISPLDGN